MTIYKELVQRVSDGETFHIDFEKRTMKIGKQKIIDNGKYDESRILIDDVDDIFDTLEVLCSIKHLYHQYKYSLPSERSDNKRQKYFKALPVDKLTDEELMSAEKREVAQAKLEGFILCMILEGKFVWLEDIMGKWFYQSKNDSDLVILRSWIENKNN
jgi:hypothetical protein